MFITLLLEIILQLFYKNILAPIFRGSVTAHRLKAITYGRKCFDFVYLLLKPRNCFQDKDFVYFTISDISKIFF